jgi:hypothetical protein
MCFDFLNQFLVFMIILTVTCSTVDCSWKLQSTDGTAFCVKFTLEGNVKAQKGSTLSLTLALQNGGGGVNATPQPLYPWERVPVLIGQVARWPHSVYYRDLFWLCTECYICAINPFKTTSVAFKNSVLTLQKMQYLSSTKISWLMLFRKTVTVCSQKKHFVDTKCIICYCLSSFILAEFVSVWEFRFVWQLKFRLWSSGHNAGTILSYNKTNEMH